jgi:magnesium transporter
LGIKKGVYPLREAMSKYKRSENALIQKDTHIFIQDLYDHVIQSMEMLDNLNSLILGIHDMYNSEISFKMNQVMQVLTITASLFIPITFIAGIYGMNFAHIPELQWQYGYLYFWILVIIIVSILLLYFKRKNWL